MLGGQLWNPWECVTCCLTGAAFDPSHPSSTADYHVTSNASSPVSLPCRRFHAGASAPSSCALVMRSLAGNG